MDPHQETALLWIHGLGELLFLSVHRLPVLLFLFLVLTGNFRRLSCL